MKTSIPPALLFCAALVPAGCGHDAPVGMIVVYEVDADPTQPEAKPSNAIHPNVSPALRPLLHLGGHVVMVAFAEDGGFQDPIGFGRIRRFGVAALELGQHVHAV